MAKKIVITGGNVTTEKLELREGGSDGRRIEARSLEHIEWEIEERANIYSFKIEKKDGSPDVFIPLGKPPKKHTKKGGGTISIGQGNKTYTYSIIWKTSENSREYSDDPIIAIKPSTSPIGPIIGLILALLGVFSFINWRMRRRKLKKK